MADAETQLAGADRGAEEDRGEADAAVDSPAAVANGVDPIQANDAVVDGFDVAEDPTKGAHAAQGQPNGAVPQHLKGVLGGVPPPAPANAANAVSASAAVEASKPKTLRTLFVARYARPDTSDIQAKITATEGKIQEKKAEVQKIIASLKEKQGARKELLEGIKEYRSRGKALNEEVKKKYEEIRPMQEQMKVLKDASNETRAAGRALQCSSIEELNKRIADINYRMHHESINLNEEKKLMKELLLLEKSRPSVEALQARRVQTDQDGHAEGLQSQLRPLLAEAAALKEQRDAEHQIADTFSEELNELDEDITGLRESLDAANKANNSLFATLQKLRQENFELEGTFRRSKGEIFHIKKAAAEKDLEKAIASASDQLKKFHDLWKDPKFRADYVKWNETSTLRRFPTLDTRRVGVDEVLKKETPKVQEKPVSKAEPVIKAKAVPAQVSKEIEKKGGIEEPENEGKKVQSTKPKAASVATNVFEVQEFDVAEAVAGLADKESQEETEESLREKRREEAIAKAKEAEERKKRQVERKQAKAAAWAAKEAEEAAKKKEKERLKKERKTLPVEEGAVEEDEAEKDGEEVTEEESVTESAEAKATGSKKLSRGKEKPAVPKSLLKKNSGGLMSFWVYFAGALGIILVALFAFLASVSPGKVASE